MKRNGWWLFVLFAWDAFWSWKNSGSNYTVIKAEDLMQEKRCPICGELLQPDCYCSPWKNDLRATKEV
jgi:hypothetical protein